MEYQQGQSRRQITLFTTCLDDMVPADNTVRFINQFVEELDLENMGFDSLAAEKTYKTMPTEWPIMNSSIKSGML